MSPRLQKYRAKRDFEVSPEPAGAEDREIAPSEHLRFVIQKHDATRLHYDLRLELGDVFKSWAVTRGPSLDPAEKRLAVEVEDHPRAYGDFEGTIPKGEYGGGTVMVWDRGFWAPERPEDPAVSLAKGELKFVLAGHKVRGSWVLVRIKSKASTDEKRTNWLLIKHRDQWATPNLDTVLDNELSVASGRSMEEIASGKGKQPVAFMTRGGKLPVSSEWTARSTLRQQSALAHNRRRAGPSTEVQMPKLTSPARVLWPPSSAGERGITKTNLAEYLVAVAPWMIDHVYGRPASLLRAPEGILKETFFQRHPLQGQAGKVNTVTVDREHQPYLQIDDAQTLVAMAQLSVIEFHPWNNLPFQPRVPERLVFDLDPAPEVSFDSVVAAAKEIRERLKPLGLEGFCKTTGGKGLHVVVPLTHDEDTTWQQAKLFSQTISVQIAADKPAHFVTKISKAARKGKIFLDYLRNDFMATAVAPLSPRARPGATVSMPLNWAQVRKGLDPKAFTILTAHDLLRTAKPWRDYDKARRSLRAAIDKLVSGAS